jgi:hypothetical protein
MATYSNVEPTYVLDLFSQKVGYATPKVGMRAAIFQGDKLLFVKERVDGCWSLLVRIFHYHRHPDLPTYFD